MNRTILLPIPVSGDWPCITANWPLTPKAWDEMMAVLIAMKPALVLEPLQSAEDEVHPGFCSHRVPISERCGDCASEMPF